ncbi:DUF551 domain-containing protein [Citrobacter portucalensis]|uniref:DUF551 domain-containing protein n=1 Tax=Citrobacter portucalensis TaxID=1639133 RepID=UPI003B2409B4
MTTNNHPAHGPVSLDRLHQIREILSKAAAQSDGGNLGYAMADAVKVINEVLERRKADKPPVHPTIADEKLDDETLQEFIEFRRSTFEYHSKEGNKVKTIIHGVVLSALLELQERRAAMLQAGDAVRDLSTPVDPQVAEYEQNVMQADNSPVTPDGWISCSERMPDNDEYKPIAIFTGKCLGQGMFVATYDDDGFFDYWEGMEIIGVSHWMPLPSAPQL